MGGIYWLASYPKSGNTWFRAFLSNFLSDSGEPVSINRLSIGQIASQRLWIDEVLGFDTSDLTQEEITNLRPEVYRWKLAGGEVGYHKIHDAYTMTPEGRPLVDDIATVGALYILRNPLDVAPSYANHKGVGIDEAIAMMGDPAHALSRSDGALSQQLLQFTGTWSHHVRSWTEAPDLNVHVIRYEDMHAFPQRTFGSSISFLGLDPEPEQLERAIRFSRFDEMSRQERQSGFRERPVRAASFFRQGQSGDWRRTLSPQQVSRVIADHHEMMTRHGYLDSSGNPV